MKRHPEGTKTSLIGADVVSVELDDNDRILSLKMKTVDGRLIKLFVEGWEWDSAWIGREELKQDEAIL